MISYGITEAIYRHSEERCSHCHIVSMPRILIQDTKLVLYENNL